MESIIDRLERSDRLDGAADRLNKALRTVVRPGPIEDTLSGTPLGHPLHPALVALPIGAWSSAMIMDAFGQREAARQLIAAGLIAAVPTSASGASDWLSTHGAEQRVGLVHALANYAAIGLYAASWRSRSHGAHTRGIVLSGAAAGLLGAAGWLGGHLAYAQGVGVDTTAFQKFPSEWTDAVAADEAPVPGELTQVEVSGVPILLIGTDRGTTAMADRCTHRGAPLHDGELVDGCVVCPWHDSAFSAVDGQVTAGPATRPQPTLEVRVEGTWLQVRRSEERALRTNPVGH